MNKEEWEKGLKAWTNIKQQALIDIEQAELYIEAINKKLEDIEEEKQNGK